MVDKVRRNCSMALAAFLSKCSCWCTSLGAKVTWSGVKAGGGLKSVLGLATGGTTQMRSGLRIGFLVSISYEQC